MSRSLPLAALLFAGCCAAPARHDPGGPRDTGTPTDTGHQDSGRDDTGDTATEDLPFPARYPVDRLQSPVTPWVRDRLTALIAGGDGLHPDVFMKVGDSITADPNALGCFAGARVDLGDRPELQATVEHFLTGEAGGSTPWDRDSRAAEVGETAAWALDGDPSPVERELSALSPAFAVVQYGTNDMQMGTTYLSAIWSFGEAMLDLVDLLLERGVVPVLVTIPPRLDIAQADAWVPTYSAVVRGIAQGRQVPLVDLERGLRALDGYGLYGDGVHLEPSSQGACVLTAAGLACGCNTRNLLVLDGLDRVRRAALEGEVLDEAGERLLGGGTAEDPFVVDALPFTDVRDTREEGTRGMDRYPDCGSDADESGPEVIYRLDLARRTTVRLLVFDRGDVDIDLHVLGATVDQSTCVDRDDSDLELTLEAGTWHVVLDTYVASAEERAGEYLLVMVEAG
ncbi:MAG: SGNH/GDSL hydrolase family protein [Pseudomonadota bacterium]